jgi:hypothetical protein
MQITSSQFLLEWALAKLRDYFSHNDPKKIISMRLITERL